MAHQRIPLAFTAGEREPGDTSDGLLKNCYAETVMTDPGQKGAQEVYVVKRPGLKSYDDLSVATTDTGRGITNWEGRIYAIVGDEVFSDETDIGQLITSTGRCHGFDIGIDAEAPAENVLVFHDGTSIYAVDDEATIAAYNNGGSGGATDIEALPTAMVSGLVVLDQYAFVMDAQGNIYNSNVGDVTAWTAADQLNAELRLDAGVAIARYLNYICAFGEDTIEFLYDAAHANGSPLSRFEGMANLIGCAAGDTVVNCDADLVFVAKSPDGGRFVGAFSAGFEAKRISTQAIDEILDKEGSNISNAYAMYMRVAGHRLYILTLPTTAGRTFVCDLDEKRWYEWTSDVSDTESYFTGVDTAELNGDQLVLDEDNGLVYNFDPETFDDETGGGNETIKVEVRTPKFDMGNMMNKFMSRLQAVGDLNTSTGTINIAWSDDDYQSWSTNRTQDLDDHQSWLTRCGMFKRRAFRIQHENTSFPMRLQGLEANISQGHYGRS